MKILLISKGNADLNKIKTIRRYVHEQKNGVDSQIICGEKFEQFIQENLDSKVHFIFDSFDTFQSEQRPFSRMDLIDRQNEQADILPKNIYKSDRRYIYNSTSEKELVLQQVFLVKKAEQIIAEFEPDFIFMTGGAKLIRNVFTFVGKHHNVSTFRILNTTYLNPNREGLRYWFCDNNYCRLSNSPENKFNHDSKHLTKHVRELIESVHTESYKLDKRAREQSAPERLKLKPMRVVKELVKKASFDTLGRNANVQAREKIRSRVDSVRNRQLHTDPSEIEEPFFVFPLNVPEDAQIVLRAPQFNDLLSVCQQVSNVLPYGYTLAIKEHPGHPGMIPHNSLKQFLRKNDQTVFLPGHVSLLKLIKRADALITINSTAGFEALVNDTPVITLGEAFYRGSELTYDVDYLFELQNYLSIVSNDPKQTNRREKLEHLLSELLQETVPGPSKQNEVDDEQYLEVIGDGIVQILQNTS